MSARDAIRQAGQLVRLRDVRVRGAAARLAAAPVDGTVSPAIDRSKRAPPRNNALPTKASAAAR